MYGRGVASIAEQIHGTKEEAQKIIDDFFNSFPKVRKWIDETQKNAKKIGYVEDLWGRRRRLPDILLPEYTVKLINSNNLSSFNPFLECADILEENNPLIEKYRNKLSKIKYSKDYEKIKRHNKIVTRQKC